MTTARLTDPGDARFEALLALYTRAIPARERKSGSDVRAMASSPEHHVLSYGVGDDVLGLALLYVGRRIALLEYLATAERVRGRGVGGRLYGEAKNTCAGLALLLEVDSPQEESADRAMRTWRVGFYRRLGCRRLAGLDFILPLAGAGEPPLLDLLVDNVPGETIDAGTVTSWLTEIYGRVYGCPPDDPRLQRMIASLPPTVPLD